MSTFVMAVADDSETYIVSTSAKTLEEATDKLIKRVVDIYDLDICVDMEELENVCDEEGIMIGQIHDVEEF